VRNLVGLVLIGSFMVAAPARAERPKPKVVATIGGEDVYQLLPVGAIPAIDDPEFVSGADADRQMRPEEPVLGVVFGGEARAYSLWQLDAHEIVNDEIAGSAIAATW
jgi:hypothetical protein